MFKIFINLLILFNFFACSLAQPVMAENLTKNHISHRAIFSWSLNPEITNQATYLNLLVDNEIKFANILNQEQKNDLFILNLDYGSNQYQLIFDDYFIKGDHYWQIMGYDQDNNLVFETAKEEFLVGNNNFSFYDFGLVSGLILINTLDQFIALLLSVGTLLFIFIFALFFFADFILTKGFINFFTKKSNKKGYVFDTSTSKNVPFAIITVKGYNHNQEYIHKTSISDVYGIYDSIRVPKGKYSLIVRKQGYDFPTRKARAQMIDQSAFYKGEEIEVQSSWENLSPLIPLDPVITSSNQSRHRTNWQAKFWQQWRGLIAWQPFFELSLLTLSIIGFFMQKNFFFILTSIFYGFLVLKRALANFKPENFYGIVVDEKGLELADAVVELTSVDPERSHSMIKITDQKGRYSFSLNPGDYILNAQKNGYIDENAVRTVNNNEIITLTRQRFYKVIRLIPVPKLEEDFFFKPDNQDDSQPTEQSESQPD